MNFQLSTLFQTKKVFFLDGDGNLYLGNRLLPGSASFIDLLNEHHKRFYICTNNSSKSPKSYLKKYQSLGLAIKEEQILISTLPALIYLRKMNFKHIFWVANDEVSSYLEGEGFIYTESSPDACLLTYDTELTYEKLSKCCELLRQNIPYYVTHLDAVCPSETGGLPDLGLFVDLIEGTLSRRPDKVFGKPSIDMISPILNSLDISLDEAVMVGDRLYTDIQLGCENALETVLNFSGETTKEMLHESHIKPDYSINSLEEWVTAVQSPRK
jgi:HAD superfamily hydrolase (TIGR01450 family)